MLTQENYQKYVDILKEELIPAMGCTEPIALAYAAAKSKEILGEFPDNIIVECSSTIIKNVMCVTIPNTNGLIGIHAAVIAGIVGGNPIKKFRVLEDLTDNHREEISKLIKTDFCSVRALNTDSSLHIIIRAYKNNEQVCVELKDHHTNIVLIEKNFDVVYKNTTSNHIEHYTERTFLNVKDILAFSKEVDLSSVSDIINNQINCNMAMANEGLTGKYGVNIGNTILKRLPECCYNKARAYTAAASEACMSGCSLPVVINSGSSNQGITASIPIIVYCHENKYPNDVLYRALVFSNLLTAHIKHGIGNTTAFCDVACASCAVSASIVFIEAGKYDHISLAISNTLASIMGISCDGAKASCGAKIASCLDAAMIGAQLALEDKGYSPNNGIVRSDIETTISAIGYIGKSGMKDLDRAILEVIMSK